MKPKTQKSALLQLLKKGKPISWITAFKATGCTRLSARIADYEKLGLVFDKVRVNFTTRYSTHGSYVTYRIDYEKTPKKVIKAHLQ